MKDKADKNAKVLGYGVSGALITIMLVCIILYQNTHSSRSPHVEKSFTPNISKSLPFLVVDLNGNGKIDTIPLETSEVYFDVDGDGLAERTEWISPEDGFLGVFDKSLDGPGNHRNQTNSERLLSVFLNNIEKIKAKNRNADTLYNEEDFEVFHTATTSIVTKLSFLIVKDEDKNGVPEGQRSKAIQCELQAFSLNADQSGKHSLKCKDREYDIHKYNLEYEDTNTIWEAVCGSLQYGGASFNENSISQFQCLEQGYEPQGMWSKNIWEEYKKGNSEADLKCYEAIKNWQSSMPLPLCVIDKVKTEKEGFGEEVNLEMLDEQSKFQVFEKLCEKEMESWNRDTLVPASCKVDYWHRKRNGLLPLKGGIQLPLPEENQKNKKCNEILTPGEPVPKCILDEIKRRKESGNYGDGVPLQPAPEDRL